MTAMPRRRPRRGFALMDVIVGGVMLGIGLAVVLTLASRAIASQAQGERQMVAAWLLDELLAMKPAPAVVWLQLGIRSAEVGEAVTARGMRFVEDRCTYADHRRLGL